MAAVSYGGAGTIAVASGAGPVTVGLPSGTVEGDVVHLSAWAADTGAYPTITIPTNWTQLQTATVDDGTIGWRHSLFRRVVPSGGISAPSLAASAGADNLHGICSRWVDCDTTTPEDVTVPAAQTGSGATMTAPGVTTVTAGAVVAYYWAIGDDATGAGSPNNGTTLAYGPLNVTAGTPDAFLAAAYKAMPVAGAAGATSLTPTGSLADDVSVGITVALRPRPAPSPPLLSRRFRHLLVR